jgi:hypothetical protein
LFARLSDPGRSQIPPKPHEGGEEIVPFVQQQELVVERPRLVDVLAG